MRIILLIAAVASILVGQSIPSWAPECQNPCSLSSPPDAIVRGYEQKLKASGIRFQTSFDGVGTSIRASSDGVSCIIRVLENSGGTTVRTLCARANGEASAIATQRVDPPAPQSQQLPTSAAAPAVARSGAVLREVVYTIEGTPEVRWVKLITENGTGGTEEHEIELPYRRSFYAKAGAFLYLSAQKARIERWDELIFTRKVRLLSDGERGTVHLSIRVAGTLVSEATASSPFGIATAKGTVPE